MAAGEIEQSAGEPASRRRWTVRDVIDFEHLLQIDGDAAGIGEPGAFGEAALRTGDRRTVFLLWLDGVRARSSDAWPGTMYTQGRRLVQAVAVALGFVVGFGLCGALLSRGDAEPVNALLFFAVTVGVQLGVLLLAALAWLSRGVGLGGLQRVTLAVVGMLGRAVDRLDGDRRAALQARWAALDLRSGRLAPLVGCQLLIVTQLFAVAFNVGLLAAMLLVHLPFEELRFGWQSTYSFTTGGIESWVRAVSAPWRWIASGLAPDTADIAATRYAPGQRAETLPADAGHAWWPFLLAAIAFYGLLLRALVAVAAGALLGYRLAHLRLASPAANALWRRIVGPLVTSEGGDATLPDPATVSAMRSASGADLLVVDDELARHDAAARASAERLLHGPVAEMVAANIDDDTLGGDLIAAIRRKGASVVVATSASRDPIVAIAGFLRALRSATGPAAAIDLLLVGDPGDDGFGQARDDRVAIWKRFVAIHRLDIGVERAP